MPQSFVDLAGWVLYGLSFLVPLGFREFRKGGRVLLVFWLAIFVRQILGLRYAYISGLAFDAVSFHLDALKQADLPWYFGIGEHFYPPLLGFFYWALGKSELVGLELTILAFSFSCVVLVKLCRLVGLERYTVPLLAIFSLTPSMIIMTSTMLREAYQILFFMASVYCGLRFRLHGGIITLLGCAVFAFLMGLLHNGLIAFAPLMVALLALWRIHPVHFRPGYLSRRLLMIVVLALPVAAGAIFAVYRMGGGAVNGSQALQVLRSGQAVVAVQQYREGGMETVARTTYGISLETTSTGATIKSLGLIMAYYMFAPFPWQISSPVDAYGAMESIFRALLLAASLATWWRLRDRPRRVASLLLVLYSGQVAMWAVGTVNYGTALRHHLVTTWILLLLGGPMVYDRARYVVRVVARKTPPPPQPA